MGLFVLLLVFQTVAMELILRRFVEHSASLIISIVWAMRRFGPG